MTEDEIIAEAFKRTHDEEQSCSDTWSQDLRVRRFVRHMGALKANPVDERTKRARELFAIAWPAHDWNEARESAFYRLVDAGCVIVTDEMRGAYENIRREFENCESLLLLDIQRIAPLFAKVKL